MIPFSVLLPVYHGDNLAHFKLSLESVLSQTLLPNEIVIVRDGPVESDLECYLVESEENSSLIKVIRFSENRGIIPALNEGMEFCANDLIARQDADDISKPDRFERQIPLFTNRPNLVILGSWIEEFEQKIGDIDLVRQVPLNRSEIISYSKTRNPFNHMSLVLRKKAIQKAGGYGGADYVEDWDLWLRVLHDKSNDVENLGVALVYARVGNGLIARRSGKIFAKKEFDFFIRAVKRGLISPWYAGVWMLRVGSRFLPGAVLKTVYNKLLRWRDSKSE